MPAIKKKPSTENVKSTPKIVIKMSEVSKYTSSLTDLERQTLEIAKSHLGSSFNMKKSIGFLNWKANQ
jgi:hypothetical protein|tara:strand:- start:8128 stop:8331 length:204 start_codon:yes stop_codon:yes gene_type:complete